MKRNTIECCLRYYLDKDIPHEINACFCCTFVCCGYIIIEESCEFAWCIYTSPVGYLYWQCGNRLPYDCRDNYITVLLHIINVHTAFVFATLFWCGTTPQAHKTLSDTFLPDSTNMHSLHKDSCILDIFHKIRLRLCIVLFIMRILSVISVFLWFYNNIIQYGNRKEATENERAPVAWFKKSWMVWEKLIHVFTNTHQEIKRGRLTIKMPSYQFRDSHVKDMTVSQTVLSLTW